MFTYSDRVIAVTARGLCPRPLWEQAERIAAAGISRIILREKDLPEAEYLALAEKMIEVCRRLGVTLILHSFADAARTVGTDRLHMPLPKLSERLCGEFVTGTSVHSAAEAAAAERMGAAYLTAGHIFATDCKKGLEPRGLGFLREVCGAVDIPVYAIGGIDEHNAQSALDAGAAGVCVMSAAMRL